MQEQKKFISTIYPFNNLVSYELDDLTKSLSTVYFKENSLVQAQESNPEFLYFVFDGLIQEINDDEVLNVYSKGEIFDSISLIKNFSKNSFVAIKDSICYSIRRDDFMQILSSNSILENYFFQSISEKLNNNVLDEKNRDLANIMIAKVKDAKIHKAVITDTKKTIFEAATIIKKKKFLHFY